MYVCLLRFTDSFLMTKDHAPRLGYMSSGLQIGLGITTLVYFVWAQATLLMLMWFVLSLLSVAVMFTASLVTWRRGYRPARVFVLAHTLLLGAVFAGLIALLGYVPTGYTEHLPPIGMSLMAILMSLALGDRITIFKQERKQAADALKASLHEKDILLRELYHRTKNNMQVIQSMLMLRSAVSQNSEVERIVTDIGHKIQAMALVHQKLYQASDLSRVPLQDYLPEIADLLQQSYGISSSRVTVRWDIAPVAVLIDTAIPCGLILNELLSNAFQHAFPDERTGEIHLHLTTDEQGMMTLQVSDNGVGVPPGFDFRTQDSLGLQSIVMIAEHQLQGTVVFTANPGVTCQIQFTDTHYQPRVYL
jgi:two-component sensor histidine kinase